MPIRHVPLWIDRVPKARRPACDRFKGSADTTVAIVGGGLTGAACAFSFAAAGLGVILLEADRVGAGATGGSPGLIREGFETSFTEAASRHGLRPARQMWSMMRRASLDFQAALRRLSAKCDLGPADLVEAAANGAEATRRFRREYQGRRDAGLDHGWVTGAALARAAALESGGGIRTHGAQLDPYRACLALVAAAAARGAIVHEQSPVRRIRAGRTQVEITLDRGTVRAGTVVIATASPILPDLRALRRHLEARHTYAIVTEPLPAEVRRAVGGRAAALQDAAAPPHVLRWLKDDRVLFTGASQGEVPARLRDRTLVQRTGQLMYELSVMYPAISGLQPEWAWDLTHYETVDRLPFVGPHRNFPRHLFAMSRLGDGAGFAWLAARILVRHLQGEPARGDDLFAFSRVL
jgi:glycine/D-amino acid oxidase-like deaminating enzyme